MQILSKLTGLIMPSPVEIRNAQFEDVYNLAEIDVAVCQRGFEKPITQPFDHNAFVRLLNDDSRFVLVAWCKRRIVGFLVCAKTEKTVIIERIAVDPNYQRRGVGCLLISYVIQKAYRCERYRSIRFVVDERLLDVQLFLKFNGFKAKILKARVGNVDRFVFSVSIPACGGV